MELEFWSNIAEFGTFDPDLTLPVNGNLIPSQIATAYNIPANNGNNIKIGIISHGGGFLQSDINKSLSDLGITSPIIKCVPVDQPIGWTPTTNFNTDFTTTNGGASAENTLDIFCIAGMIPGADITIYIGGLNTLTGWNNVFNRAILDNCDVITHSWSVSENYGDFLATTLASAESKNILVFNSTGDYGSRDKAGVLGTNYPASNANVISVGGTILTLNSLDNSWVKEIASRNSGGGISKIIPVLPWQQGLTYKTYNSSTKTYGPVTNLTMRGVPDVAAPYSSYAFYFGGIVLTGIGGTSASTPIMAGIMARFISLNGRQPNFVQKSFYENSTAFRNISTGDNASVLSEGYSVTEGWDPVTGLGSPIGQTLYSKLKYPPLGKVKNNTGTWSSIKDVWVKQSYGWTQVKDVWVKTETGWQRPN